VEELITALRLRGVILTGGNDLAHLPDATDTAPERDAFERNLLEVCTRRRLPVLGVCRGMQMLVDHCGGRVGPIEGHVATMHALTMHPLARKCPFPMPGLERQAVNSFHRYGTLVGQEGPALRVAASARDGTVEAVVHESLPQWGIMWHPERSPNDPGDRLILSTLFAKAST
jgi:putative glutamine amidotransferase